MSYKQETVTVKLDIHFFSPASLYCRELSEEFAVEAEIYPEAASFFRLIQAHSSLYYQPKSTRNKLRYYKQSDIGS